MHRLCRLFFFRRGCYHSPAIRSSNASDKRWFLRQISLFTTLNESQLDLVAEHFRIAEYEKDFFIYRHGEPADAFYGLVGC